MSVTSHLRSVERSTGNRVILDYSLRTAWGHTRPCLKQNNNKEQGSEGPGYGSVVKAVGSIHSTISKLNFLSNKNVKILQFHTKTKQKKPLSIKKNSDLDYSLWVRDESLSSQRGPRRWGWDSSILDQVLSNACMHTQTFRAEGIARCYCTCLAR